MRKSLEESITRLEAQRTEKQEKRLYVEHEIRELERLKSDSGSLFADYQKPISDSLAMVETGSLHDARLAIHHLLASLVLTNTHIRIALSGGVNRKALRSTVFVIAPGSKQSETGDHVLIEDIIALPEARWMLTAGELRVLYVSHRLNTWQIARMARMSHSTIIGHMKRHGIAPRRRGKCRQKYFSLLAALLA